MQPSPPTNVCTVTMKLWTCTKLEYQDINTKKISITSIIKIIMIITIFTLTRSHIFSSIPIQGPSSSAAMLHSEAMFQNRSAGKESPWESSQFSAVVFCGPAGHCRFACKRILHWNMHSTKAHYIMFINCCLTGPLPVPASARHHDWAFALACWGMQLLRVSFERLSVVKI
jgi:hypothetical protein